MLRLLCKYAFSHARGVGRNRIMSVQDVNMDILSKTVASFHHHVFCFYLTFLDIDREHM